LSWKKKLDSFSPKGEKKQERLLTKAEAEVKDTPDHGEEEKSLFLIFRREKKQMCFQPWEGAEVGKKTGFAQRP